MATIAEQAVIDAARALYDNTTTAPITAPGVDGWVMTAESLDALARGLTALDAEQAPPPPYVADQQCGYLDHHTWLIATVEKIEPHPERPGQWLIDLCVKGPHGEHRMTKTVNDAGVGENVAPMRER